MYSEWLSRLIYPDGWMYIFQTALPGYKNSQFRYYASRTGKTGDPETCYMLMQLLKECDLTPQGMELLRAATLMNGGDTLDKYTQLGHFFNPLGVAQLFQHGLTPINDLRGQIRRGSYGDDDSLKACISDLRYHKLSAAGKELLHRMEECCG